MKAYCYAGPCAWSDALKSGEGIATNRVENRRGGSGRRCA